MVFHAASACARSTPRMTAWSSAASTWPRDRPRAALHRPARAARRDHDVGHRLAGARRGRVLPGHRPPTAGVLPPPDHPLLRREVSTSRTTCSTDRGRDDCTWSATGRSAGHASPGRATGMRDIVATIQREQDEAIRSPATAGHLVGAGRHRQDGRRAAPRRLPALRRSPPVRERRRAGRRPVTTCSCLRRTGAAVARRGAGHAALPRSARRRRARPPREDARRSGEVKGSLRMRKVLRRAPPRTRPSTVQSGLGCGCGTEENGLSSTGARWRRSGGGWGAARGVTRCAARLFGEVLDALWASVWRDWAHPHIEQSRFDDDLSDHEDFRAFLRHWWPLVTAKEVLSWLADPPKAAPLRRWFAGAMRGAAVA